MQIGLFMTDTDEQALVAQIVRRGARFIPQCHPVHPLPVLSLPLPSVAEPYMAALCIWFPSVFSEHELSEESRTLHNPASDCYVAAVLPVLLFNRPHVVRTKLMPASLQMDATARSFRFGRPSTGFTDEELVDFNERLSRLRNEYRHLGRWIRANWAPIGRGGYIGLHAAEEVNAGHLRLPWAASDGER